MTKNRTILTALCVLASAILTMTGCGKHEGPHSEENKKVLSEYVSGGTTASDGIDEIVRLLEEIEPGCRFLSVEETGELDGGYLIDIKTYSGNEYTVNTSTDGEIGNITNKNTGEMLYPSDQYPGEDDDSDEPIATDVNTSFLMEKGISKENARKIAEAVDHAAPNELINRVEGYDPSEIDIKITVYMETGKIFYVTVTEEDGWNATISETSL